MKKSTLLLPAFSIFMLIFTSCEKENSVEMVSPCSGVEIKKFTLLDSLDIEENYFYRTFVQSDKYLIANVYKESSENSHLLILDKSDHQLTIFDVPRYINNITIVGDKVFFSNSTISLSYIDILAKSIHYTVLNDPNTWGYIVQIQEFENNLGLLFFHNTSGYYYYFLYDVNLSHMTILHTARRIKDIRIERESMYTKLYKNSAHQTCLLFLFRDYSSNNSYVYSINTETAQDEYFQNVGSVYKDDNSPNGILSNNHSLLLYYLNDRKVFDIRTGLTTEVDWIGASGDYIFTKSGEILEGSELIRSNTFPVPPFSSYNVLALQKNKKNILMKISNDVVLLDLQTHCVVKRLPMENREIIPDVNNENLYIWDAATFRKNSILKYE